MSLVTQAVWLTGHGGPEVLRLGELQLAEPGPAEVRVRQTAVGLNFAEVYQRRGAAGPHAAEHLPMVIGTQGAGVIEAMGAEVSGLAVGDPVAYVHEQTYAGHVLVPSDRVLPLPDTLTPELAAAFLVRGLTAEYLLHRLRPMQAGERILVHAAAGGMGEVLCQWGRALGLIVIGTVGSEGKRARALAHGCHQVIVWRDPDWVEQVLRATDGDGVAVVYDAIGKDVFLDSLDCLQPRGLAVNYGTASGDVQAFDLQRLHARSLMVCRPTLKTTLVNAGERHAATQRFVAALDAGHLRLQVSWRWPLAEAAAAHAELESGQTTGAGILVP